MMMSEYEADFSRSENASGDPHAGKLLRHEIRRVKKRHANGWLNDRTDAVLVKTRDVKGI